MPTATQTEKSFELKGVSPGGCRERYTFIPRGDVVCIEFYFGFTTTVPLRRSLVPLARARELYAMRVKSGFQRVA